MRHLQQIHTELEDKGLVLLGVNVADDKAIALEMLHDNEVTFPNVLDASQAATKVIYQDYSCVGVPLNYIIDRDGNVVDAWYTYGEGYPHGKAVLKELGIE